MASISRLRFVSAAAGAVGVYLLAPAIAIIRQNVEVWSSGHGYDRWLTEHVSPTFSRLPLIGQITTAVGETVAAFWTFISGDFALGFAAASLCFALWDPFALLLWRVGSRNERRDAEKLIPQWLGLAAQIQADLERDRGRVSDWSEFQQLLRDASEKEQARLWEERRKKSDRALVGWLNMLTSKYRRPVQSAFVQMNGVGGNINTRRLKKVTKESDFWEISAILVLESEVIAKLHDLSDRFRFPQVTVGISPTARNPDRSSGASIAPKT